MKKLVFISALLLFITNQSIQAQTSAGQAVYFDYLSWSQGGIYPPMYIDCGNNGVFNTGNELTLEVWIRVFDAGWNQKIIGKMDDQLNNGYVMGIELLKNYSEVFNPSHYELKAGSMPLDSSWIHLATTYKAGDAMTLYVNGVNVGQQSVSNNPLVSNSNPLRMGVAPWDLHALQFFGHIDEVHVWNVARTEDQIKETMFKRLNGNETGLIAYYNFDQTSGSTVPDLTANGNNGTVICDEADYWSWASSYAPVGDEIMSNMTDVVAAWPGKGEVSGPYATTTRGLSLLTSIQFKKDQYAVFGHNNLTGVTTENFSANVPASFQRTSREWYINKAGNISADFLFDLSNAAGGGAELPSTNDVSYYTLFVRSSISDDYEPLCSANQKNGDILTFKNVVLQNKYYTIGVGDENIAPPASIASVDKNTFVRFYPNPAKDVLYVETQFNEPFVLEVFSSNGQLIKTEKFVNSNGSIDVSNLSQGLYIVSVNRTDYEQIFIIK